MTNDQHYSPLLAQIHHQDYGQLARRAAEVMLQLIEKEAWNTARITHGALCLCMPETVGKIEGSDRHVSVLVFCATKHYRIGKVWRNVLHEVKDSLLVSI